MSPILPRLVRLSLALALMTILVLPSTAARANATSWIVNTVDDADDGVCDNAHCSLREAINASNATAGVQTIGFDIPGPTPHIIELCNPLPTITDEVVVDGTLEPDYSPGAGPVVAIAAAKGAGCTPAPYGLWIEAGGSVVRGLSIVGFDTPNDPLSAGIVVYASSGILVEDSYLGLLPGGTPRGNHNGVLLGSTFNRIHGNVISGNTFGVNAVDGLNLIDENRIGTDPDGTSTGPTLRNTVGVYIQETAPDNRIGKNGGGNLISGNGTGIYLASPGNYILGNRIGTNANGNSALGNDVGINAVDTAYTLVGGANTWMRNLISGNAVGLGVGDHSMIWGNFIGTNHAGTSAIPNQIGVSIQAATDVHIGGTASGQGNLISGNSIAGIVLHEGATDVEVFANRIGTDVSGFGPLANGRGVSVQGSGNFIGDPLLGGGNGIAYNFDEGVLLLAAASDNYVGHNTIHDNGAGVYAAHDTTAVNTFNMNLFHDNAALAIDLAPLGPNLNDPGDADGGANERLNYPEFTEIDAAHVAGTACPGCTVEVYLSNFDPSGHGEGETLLGWATAGSAGDFHFNFPSTLSPCDHVTATATDSAGNTSEFSRNGSAGFCFYVTAVAFTGIAGLEGAIVIISLFVVRRLSVRAGLSAGRAALAGLAAGVILGAGVFGAIRALPNVVWDPPPGESRDPSEFMLPCEAYLMPGSVHPVEGARASFGPERGDWMPPDPLGREGEGEMPPDPLGQDGDEEMPPDPLGQAGEDEMPPDPLGQEGDSEMPPDPLGREGEGEMPPDPLGQEGEGEMPPDPLGQLSLSWTPRDPLFDDGEHGDGQAELGNAQWRVEVMLPGAETISRVTTEHAVALSSFGIGSEWLMDDGEHGDGQAESVMDDGEHGDGQADTILSASLFDDGEHGDGPAGQPLFWRLTGEAPAEDGSMLAFCRPTNWTSFRLGDFDRTPPPPWQPSAPPPPEPGEAEEEAPPETCDGTITATMNLTCRAGPASEYKDLGYLLQGETATIEGRNLESTWWWILNPDWQGHCWVWAGGAQAACVPDDLPVITAPPLPTLVCKSNLGKDDCVAAGGTYLDATVTMAPVCQCP